jgi:hypothetical protein
MTVHEITADAVKLYRLHSGRIALQIKLPDGRSVGAVLEDAEEHYEGFRRGSAALDGENTLNRKTGPQTAFR